MIRYDLPESEYRAADALNYSTLKTFMDHPQRAFFGYDQPRSSALDFGKAFDALVTGESEVLCSDGDRRSKSYKDLSFKHPSAVIVTPPEWDKIQAMKAELDDNPDWQTLRDGGKYQVSYLDDKRKARADLLVPGQRVVDIKTTADASVKGFTNSIYRYKYWLQAAWYTICFGVNEFYLVAVEKTMPYTVGVYTFGSDILQRAQKRALDLEFEYRAARKINRIPITAVDVKLSEEQEPFG